VPERWRERPFRAPHHTASGVAIVGGGSHARPGEISLAHHGVLFLDELPEWDRRVLEVLREPLESGVINISRAARQSTFPAQFQLVAAMNPCPCGWYGHPGGRCHCGPELVRRYRGRISGPLLDRIDLAIDVPAVAPAVLASSVAAQAESPAVQARVVEVRERQIARQGRCNARLAASELAACGATAGALRTLSTAMSRMQLSARAFHRVLKVARTIADLAGDANIATAHVNEAIAYRQNVLATSVK
jgi:magnesium chelatase family protein